MRFIYNDANCTDFYQALRAIVRTDNTGDGPPIPIKISRKNTKAAKIFGFFFSLRLGDFA
jgi:hypothetical protein